MVLRRKDMEDRRKLLAESFFDTEKFYSSNAMLKDSVRRGGECIEYYEPNSYSPLEGFAIKSGKPMVNVTREKTIEAALRLCKDNPDKNVAVLNFASATNPGGGVRNGSSAQEESLCRCTTLYPSLHNRDIWNSYYAENRKAKDTRYSDALLYTPSVLICKNDSGSVPVRLNETEFEEIGVITCAAPNLRHEPEKYRNPVTKNPMRMAYKELLELHEKRARHILNVAVSNNVDIMVLGAFGCGAFENDPDTVAEAYVHALQEYWMFFDQICFAVYCSKAAGYPRKNEMNNFKAFSSAMKVFK